MRADLSVDLLADASVRLIIKCSDMEAANQFFDDINGAAKSGVLRLGNASFTSTQPVETSTKPKGGWKRFFAASC